jgi:tetratricopeptide (TPR) repeat protein
VFTFSLFPNSSIAGICIAVLLLFLIPFIIRRNNKWLIFLLTSGVLFFSALLLLSNSRAGWLGFAVGCSFVFCRYSSWQKRWVLVLLTLGLFFFLLLYLYFYKQDSSAGRTHIYSISLEMLSDNWVWGIGIGKFKARFNEYQADYFFTHSIDNKRALLADNTFYAFNDYLQWVIESGIIGLLLLQLFLYLTISRIIHLLKQNRPIIIAVTSALICVAVAALFSYPLQVIPIQALVLVCLGSIVFCPAQKLCVSKKQKITSFTYKFLILLLVVVFVSKVWNERDRIKIEKKAFCLARAGYKTDAIKLYKQAVEKYPGAGYNWVLYAQQLYYANRLQEAYENLNKGMFYYIDSKVYELKAVIEQELAMYSKAERSYLRAIHMVPNRMGSRLNLLKFYVYHNDKTNAIYWANAILNMPVKVPSFKIDAMLQETKTILAMMTK